MSNLLEDGQELLPVAKAAKNHKAFASVHPATVQRWARKGINRNGRVVKLESLRVGSSLCTTQAALDRFLTALNESEGETAPAPRTPNQRRRDSDKASAELDRRMSKAA